MSDRLKQYRRRRRRPSRRMPDDVKAELAERRRRKRVEDDARRLEMGGQRSSAGCWRRIVLSRYVRCVLQRDGAARLEWFADHPLSDMFK